MEEKDDFGRKENKPKCISIISSLNSLYNIQEGILEEDGKFQVILEVSMADDGFGIVDENETQENKAR